MQKAYLRTRIFLRIIVVNLKNEAALLHPLSHH